MPHDRLYAVTMLKLMNFKLDPDIHSRFKAAARARGVSMTSVIVASIEAFIDGHQNAPRAGKARNPGNDTAGLNRENP